VLPKVIEEAVQSQVGHSSLGKIMNCCHMESGRAEENRCDILGHIIKGDKRVRTKIYYKKKTLL